MTGWKSALVAVGFIAVSFAAAGIPQLIWDTQPDDWYRNLEKPAFNPPSWVFGPVWTVLYILMGTAAWLVWRKYPVRPVWFPLTLFFIQLVLNAAWTPLFFTFHELALAFAELVVLWLAILATTAAFFRVSPLAGWLMVPYLVWTAFAAVLNYTLWQLNA